MSAKKRSKKVVIPPKRKRQPLTGLRLWNRIRSNLSKTNKKLGYVHSDQDIRKWSSQIKLNLPAGFKVKELPGLINQVADELRIKLCPPSVDPSLLESFDYYESQEIILRLPKGVKVEMNWGRAGIVKFNTNEFSYAKHLQAAYKVLNEEQMDSGSAVFIGAEIKDKRQPCGFKIVYQLFIDGFPDSVIPPQYEKAFEPHIQEFPDRITKEEIEKAKPKPSKFNRTKKEIKEAREKSKRKGGRPAKKGKGKANEVELIKLQIQKDKLELNLINARAKEAKVKVSKMKELREMYKEGMISKETLEKLLDKLI